MNVEKWEQAILAGERLDKDGAMALWQAPLEPLREAADRLRQHFCGDGFDLCTIVNGKSGQCSEDCSYCAQSVRCRQPGESYPLMSPDQLREDALRQHRAGVPRYSVVTSGRALSDGEIESLCGFYQSVSRGEGPALCASHGLLNLAQLTRLKEAGVRRYHNNLESSRRFFPCICTTHTYDDKIQTIRWAQQAGLEVCSGGIIGLGETREDRVDLALTLGQLGIRSVPVNVLNPIAGTALEDASPLPRQEVERTVAIFRFLLPRAAIRLAGGRGLLGDSGEGCFRGGANAAITGDMLTTSGICVERDLALTRHLGYQVVRP